MVGDVAGGAQVDDLDLAARVALDQNILGLQVGVDERQRVQEGQRAQHLHSAAQHSGHSRVSMDEGERVQDGQRAQQPLGRAQRSARSRVRVACTAPTSPHSHVSPTPS